MLRSLSTLLLAVPASGFGGGNFGPTSDPLDGFKVGPDDSMGKFGKMSDGKMGAPGGMGKFGMGADICATSLDLRPEAMAAMSSTSDVTVTAHAGEYTTFQPKDSSAASGKGLVLFSGGPVYAQAYAPLAQEIAAAGHSVFLIDGCGMGQMFDPTRNARVEGIQKTYPMVTSWAVGGHSLGAVVATMTAQGLPAGSLDGVLFWDACLASKGVTWGPAPADTATGAPADMATQGPPTDSATAAPSFAMAPNDLSKMDLDVMVILRNAPTAFEMHNSPECKELLPADASFRVIEDANHSQFGYYFDPKDAKVALSLDQQQDLVLKDSLEFMAGL
jgi:hypothetical protein